MFPPVLRQKIISSYVLALLAGAALADDVKRPTGDRELSAVEVRAKAEDMSGIASAGSEGVVARERVEALPLLRPAEALELVPGMIATQHSGDGKANQYFLRGFNLDHGTDFRTTVAGVPVNMPTHAHGQGYTDLNFLIPELVDRVRYRKGPYYADEGDFSSAGAAHIDYARKLDGTLASLTYGSGQYGRALLAGSPEVGRGNLLYALEWSHNDGPWQVPEHFRKLNGVLRYSQGSRNDGWSVTGMAYRAEWTATDQVPKRAVDSGVIKRFGSLDPTSGGETHRYSLSADWARSGQGSQSRANVWAFDYALDLYSNFTYCAADFDATGSCDNGDQFKQKDRRRAGGFDLGHTVYGRWGAFDVENTIGADGRLDRIRPVGLYSTTARTVTAVTREDEVSQRSLALYVQNQTYWLPWLRTQLGLRADHYRFDVDSNVPENSGKRSDHMLSPKFAAIFGPWAETEIYTNWGRGFHSNDARGSTIRVDPVTRLNVDADGNPIRRVDPLVRSTGYELGLRSKPAEGWQTTVALWRLDLDSELLFVGDAGITEPSRPSRRQGVEWNNLWTVNRWLSFDADLSFSHARFRDRAPEGDHIPGAVATTANLGMTVDALGPWFGALRLRYFGPRPLIEDNTEKSASTTLANLRLGYRVDRRTTLALDVFNLFDRKASDIDYWYSSQLRGEAAAVDGIHFHPAEPRNFRLTLTHRF
jgi:outer membrane receptor protein involved in Fe transport